MFVEDNNPEENNVLFTDVWEKYMEEESEDELKKSNMTVDFNCEESMMHIKTKQKLQNKSEVKKYSL